MIFYIFFLNSYFILDGTLFVAGISASGCGKIVRYDAAASERVIDIYSGHEVYDVAVLGKHLVFVELSNGIKAVLKDGTGTAYHVYTSGLQYCTHFYSIHVIKGMRY